MPMLRRGKRALDGWTGHPYRFYCMFRDLRAISMYAARAARRAKTMPNKLAPPTPISHQRIGMGLKMLIAAAAANEGKVTCATTDAA